MKVLDLTQTIHYEMHIFESYPKPLRIPWAKLDIHGFESELIFMSSHTGTHMDAPVHFFPKGKTIDMIAVEKFVSDAILLRINKKRKGLIRKEDIVKLESKVHIRKGDAVILSTGWEDHANRNHYLSDNPGLSEDGAKYLASKSVSIVGIDTANIDHPDAKNFPAHNILLPREVLIVENLCNLKKIGQNSFRLIVLPLKIMGATGSPVRAIALL